MIQTSINQQEPNNLRVAKVMRSSIVSNSFSDKREQKNNLHTAPQLIPSASKPHCRQKAASFDFVVSLISKIKNVDRLKAGSSQKNCAKASRYRESLGINFAQNNEQSKNYFYQYLRLDKTMHQIQNESTNPRDKLFAKNNYFEEQYFRLREENKDLKSRIRQLVGTVQVYNKKIMKIQKDLVKKNASIAEYQIYIKQKQEKFAYQLAQINQKINIIEREKEELTTSLSEQKMKKYKNIMNLRLEISQKILPVAQSPLLKAQQELKQMKIDMLSLQKRCFNSYNQLKKSKDEEIEHLRMTFFKNLNHYKSIIMKFTSKSGQQPKKLLDDDLVQTTILEISSEQSVDESNESNES